MSGSPLPRDDGDIAAAEFVLGTLDRDERAAFAERLSSDSGAKLAVSRWEQRFAPLAGRIDPIEPPDHVWRRIERAIRDAADGRRSFDVVNGGVTADRLPRVERSRDRWRTAAMASAAIAAALLVFVVSQIPAIMAPRTPDGGTSYVAAVNRGGDKPALLVRVDLKTHQVFVRPVAAEVPAGHSLELWYIGDDKTPKSMGLVDQVPATIRMPQGAQPAGATFAVSVEPQGGSKSGAPTGPVVYAGQLIKE